MQTFENHKRLRSIRNKKEYSGVGV